MTSEAHHDRLSNITNPLHIVLVPLMAPGHMIPMVDIARLLASRGVFVTVVTTPVNLARIRPIVDRAAAASLPIRFVDLRFAVADAGLPDGCESADLVPSPDLMFCFMNALALLRDPLEAYLRVSGLDSWPPPACLISDNLHHWTADVARSLNIPRLIFHGTSCFFLFCSLLIHRQKPELVAAVEEASGGPIILPGLPHPILVNKQQVISVWDSKPDWMEYLETVAAAEKSANGVLVNSFTELEPWYLKEYHEAIAKPVWPIGPVSLYKEEVESKADRGRVSPVDKKLLFRWLDGQKVGSVVFVSFGSTVRHSKAQIIELGCGLESSGRPFVWMVKVDGEDPTVEEWLTEYEKEVEGRGVIIRDWAPQAMILEHVAVGGFLTHCGWNSTLEAVAAGMAMITWPCFWDQFLNERFIVDVLMTGVAVGVTEGMMMDASDGDERVELKVRREDVERALERLMGGAEEAEARRARARELSNKAKMAMEEGGSSWKGYDDVIHFILECEKKVTNNI